MNKGLEELKKQWNDNPVVVLGVTAAVMAGAAKLITALSSASNSRAWSREVKRRQRKDKVRL